MQCTTFQRIVFTILLIVLTSLSTYGQFTVKTRVSGSANWNTKATWIQLRTGTVAFTNGSTTVTGTSTKFLTELQVGDILMMDASPATVRGTVQSITSNTSLKISVAATATVATAAYGRQFIPATTDNVQIGNANIASAITLTLNTTTTIGSLTFIADNVAHSLTHSGSNSLTVSNGVTLNQPTNTANVNWNINAGTATVGGLISFAGTNITTSYINNIVLTTGTLNAGGGITFASSTTNATKVIQMTGAATLNLEGALTVPAGTLTASTSSTFNYMDNSSAQTVNLFPGGAYGNLYLNNTSSGGATLGAAITSSKVTGNIRVQSGTFSNGGYSIGLATTKIFEVANGAEFDLTGTSGMVTGTSITKTFGASSTVDYAGTNQTISSETYGNLILSNSGTKSMAASPMTVQGDFTVDDFASFVAGNSLDINGDVTFGANTSINGGAYTHDIAGNWTDNGATLSGTSSVIFDGTGTQTLGGATAYLAFNNITVTNATGSIVVNKAMTLLGTLNMNGATTLFIPDATVIINSAVALGSVTGTGTVKVTRSSGSADFDAQYNFSSYTTTNLTVDFSATSNQTVDAITYGGLKATGSGTKTAAGAITVNSALTINSGVTLNMGNNALSGGFSSVIGTGTLQTTNTTSTPIPSGKTWTQTVEYNKATGAQTIVSGTYANLKSNNTSGTNTISSGATITGTFTMTTTSTVQMTGSSTVTLNNLTMLTNAALTLNGPLLKIAGTITNSGKITATTGKLEMNGTSAQSIPANLFLSNNLQDLTTNNAAGVTLNGTLNLSGTLKATTGTFNTGGYLTLLSTASKTALIDGSGAGSVTGNVTMQRYLPSGFGYKYFSSPFQSSKVSEFSNDLNLNASFPTFYSYDETLYSAGWVNYTTTTNSLQPLKGYAANFGSSSAAKTVDMTGVVNNGTVSLSTIYNNNRPYTKGFQLVGNPYPSPIDWNAASGWTKTNVDNAIYFFDAGSTNQYTGTYSSYINGVSSNGVATNIIPAMQGFFIHVSNGTYPVTGSISINNNARTTGTSVVFHKTTGTPKQLFRLSVGNSAADTIKDHLAFYTDNESTDGYDTWLDALKMLNTDTSFPAIYAKTSDDEKLSIEAIHELNDEETIIPLGVYLYNGSNVHIDAQNADLARPGMHAYWLDAGAGTYHDLSLNPSFDIALPSGKYEDRFYLVFTSKTSPSMTAPGKLTAWTGNGKVFVTLDAITGKEGMVSIIDMQGRVVSQTRVDGYATHAIEMASEPGMYLVSFLGSHGRLTQKVLVGSR